MSGIRTVAGLAFALLLGCRADKQKPLDEYVVGPSECAAEVPRQVMSAARHEDELWVIDSALHLWSLSLGSGQATRRLADDLALPNLVVSGDTLVALTEHSGAARLRSHRAGKWDRAVDVELPGATLLARGDELLVLGRDRAIVFARATLARLRDVPLAPPLPQAMRPRAWSGDTVYLTESGEERSSLAALGLSDGRLRPVAARGEVPCHGLLDDRCDPIDSVAPDPARQGCVLVATRAEPSRAADARLLRVCGAEVTRAFPGRSYDLRGLGVVDGRVCGLVNRDIACLREDGTEERTTPKAPHEVCRFPIRAGEARPLTIGKPDLLLP